jgi:hypothetical protein
MSRSNLSFAKLVLGAAALLFIPLAQAQLTSVRPSQRLPMPPDTAPQPTQPARFGEFVATDGRTILVTVSQGPAAYTYVKRGSKKWVFQGALAPAEGTVTNSGAVRGNVAAVSGRVGTEEAVFVFLRSQGQWLQTQTITGADLSPQFNMVALGPDYLAIGDTAENDVVGALHVYSQTGAGTYVLDSTLTPGNPNATQGWLFGASPIVSGDTLTARALGGGTVNVFVRAGGLWTEQAELSQHIFGQYGFSGDRAFISFDNTSEPGPREYVRTGGTWTTGVQLIHPDADKAFTNAAIAMDGRRVVVTESSSTGLGDDAIAFELGNAGWTATARLRRANLRECYFGPFGVSLAMVRRLVVAGCPNAPSGHTAFEGNVKVYELPE